MDKINFIQFIIAVLLFCVLTFGIGFILNMLLKTTWLPIYIYGGVVIFLFFYYGSGKSFGWVDYAIGIAGLIGVGLGGWAIRLLRTKGYQMF